MKNISLLFVSILIPFAFSKELVEIYDVGEKQLLRIEFVYNQEGILLLNSCIDDLLKLNSLINTVKNSSLFISFSVIIAKGVPPLIDNITFYPEGTTMLGFYDNPFEGIDSFVKYIYSLLSLEDISYFETPKFVYSQLSDAYICTESIYKWIYFSKEKGLKGNSKWIRDNIVKIMNSEYYSFELKLEKNAMKMELLLYNPKDKELFSSLSDNDNYNNTKTRMSSKTTLKSNSILASYLYEKSLFTGQLTIILNNPNNYKMNGIINVILPQLIIPEFYKQKIMVNNIEDNKISTEKVFNVYELKNKKSILYSQNITLNEKSNYIWVIPYKKTFMNLKSYPSNCAHGLDVPPVEFITENNNKIYHSTLSTTIFPYPDFSMIYNMVCFISACLCLLVTQILNPISYVENKKEEKNEGIKKKNE